MPGVILAVCADASAWPKYRRRTDLTDSRRAEREFAAQRRTTERPVTRTHSAGLIEESCAGVGSLRTGPYRKLGREIVCVRLQRITS